MWALLLLLPLITHGLPAEYECPHLLPAVDAPQSACATSFATVLASRWQNNTRTLSASYMLDCCSSHEEDTVARLVEGLSASGCLVSTYNTAESVKKQCERALSAASKEYITATLGQQRVSNVYVVDPQELVTSLAFEIINEGPVVSHNGDQCVVIYGWLANESWMVLHANGTRAAVAVRDSVLQRQWWAWLVQRTIHEPIENGRAPLQVLFMTALTALTLLLLFSSCDCCPPKKRHHTRAKKKHCVLHTIPENDGQQESAGDFGLGRC